MNNEDIKYADVTANDCAKRVLFSYGMQKWRKWANERFKEIQRKDKVINFKRLTKKMRLNK